MNLFQLSNFPTFQTFTAETIQFQAEAAAVFLLLLLSLFNCFAPIQRCSFVWVGLRWADCYLYFLPVVSSRFELISGAEASVGWIREAGGRAGGGVEGWLDRWRWRPLPAHLPAAVIVII